MTSEVFEAPEARFRASHSEKAMGDAIRKELLRSQVVAGPVWHDVQHFRISRNESQADFWEHFGVTQSAGSRYEDDTRKIPTSVHMMVIALALGLIDVDALKKLRKASNEVSGGIRQ